MTTTPDDRPCVAPKVGDMVRLRDGSTVGPLENWFTENGYTFVFDFTFWKWTGAFGDGGCSTLDIVEIIPQPREIYVARGWPLCGGLKVFDTKDERDAWRSTQGVNHLHYTLHTYREVIE